MLLREGRLARRCLVGDVWAGGGAWVVRGIGDEVLGLLGLWLVGGRGRGTSMLNELLVNALVLPLLHLLNLFPRFAGFTFAMFLPLQERQETITKP